MRAAMTLAGLTFPALAKAIATKGYSTTTLRNIANDASERDVRPSDLYVIGRACGVGPGWWTLDFMELEDSTLRNEVSELRRSVLDLSAVVARHGQALTELRDQDPRTGSG